MAAAVTERMQALRAAETKAAHLFAEIEARGIIAAGVSERAASDAIRDLAAELFGVSRHWHKRIVRAGVNAMEPYRANPPDRVIAEDDIVYLDFGPVFEDWEADFGRTFVLGSDEHKLRLCGDLEQVWELGRQHFRDRSAVTGAELFDHMVALAVSRGWKWGGSIAGHLVGHFPHAGAPGGDRHGRIAPGNDQPLRGLDAQGEQRHWILEVHLVDRSRQIGGFYEQLLDVP